MDEFIVGLIAVFVILGILLLATAYYPYYPEGVPDEIRVIDSFTAGTVGYTENYVSRVQNYGDFGVGIPQDEVLKSVPKMEITAGLFGGNSETFDITVPDYVIDWLKGGEITFRVTDTNKYGNLMILWNGAELYSEKSYEGEHEVVIDPSQIKDDNTLEIKAVGPGLAFWAATAYVIEDFSLTAQYGPAKYLDFTVSQDELETLDTFELLWYTSKRKGTLAVEVNGEEIYRGVPDRDFSLDFKDTTLKNVDILPGVNRLIFKAYNGSFELNDVILNTHVSMAQKVVRERFDLTDAQVEQLKSKGAILKLFVNNVDKAGQIRIDINGHSAGSSQGKEGWNQITLDTDYLEPGSNWLEIRSVGAYDITEASVEISM